MMIQTEGHCSNCKHPVMHNWIQDGYSPAIVMFVSVPPGSKTPVGVEECPKCGEVLASKIEV